MESYGIVARNDLVVEHVERLPVWNESDQGRIIYNKSTKRCYLGRFNGWEPLGIYKWMIKNDHLLTDDNLTGSNHAISAIRIPVHLNLTGRALLDEISSNYKPGGNTFDFDLFSNVQFLFNAVYSRINSDVKFDNNTIEHHHLSDDGLTLFQSELIDINNLSSNDIEIKQDNSIGYHLGLDIIMIHDVLIDLSTFLININADDIYIDVSTLSDTSNVQFMIDEINDNYLHPKLIDIVGIPTEYSENTLSALKTDGISESNWIEPTASNIKIKFPNIFKHINSEKLLDVTRELYFHPSENCIINSIQNIISFDKVSHAPVDFYSTGVQQGIDIIRNITCDDPPRSMACDPILIVNSDDELNKSKRIEQHKNDANCTSHGLTTDCYNYKFPENDCIISTSPSNLNELLSTLPLLDRSCNGSCYDSVSTSDNLIDLETVFNTWNRYATNNNNPNLWEYVGESIHSTANFQYLSYFYSLEVYERYSFELTVRSGSSDDDYIVLVAAHGENSNICVVRTKGADNQTGNPQPTYFVAYNFNLPGQTILASAANIEQGGIEGWNGDYSRLFVCRFDNTLTIACSPFGSETVNEDTQVTINLEDYPDLSGPRPVGFGCFSQNDSWFSSPDLHTIDLPPGVENDEVPNVYDPSEFTMWIWISETCSWDPRFIEQPCGGYINRPKPCTPSLTSCSQLETNIRLIYDIRDEYVYEWNLDNCSWEIIQCPDWLIFESNTIYYNDITCKLFYSDCHRQFNQLIL